MNPQTKRIELLMIYLLIFNVFAFANSWDGLTEHSDRGYAKHAIAALEQVIPMEDENRRNAQLERMVCVNNASGNFCTFVHKGRRLKVSGRVSEALISLLREMQIDTERDSETERFTVEKLFCDEWPYKVSSHDYESRYHCVAYTR